MLTPQEVSERSFTRAAFNGYNMAQVDEFLDILTQDYTALYNDNALLKNKLKVLVDTVEEYRSTEEGMRRALRAAQRQADELVEEAQREKERILRETEEDARQKMAQVNELLATEQFRLKQAQETTAAFVAQVQALNAKQAQYLDSIQDLCPTVNAAKVEDTAAAIDSSMQHILEQNTAEEPDATTAFSPVSETAEEPDEVSAEDTENVGEQEDLDRTQVIPFPQQDQE